MPCPFALLDEVEDETPEEPEVRSRHIERAVAAAEAETTVKVSAPHGVGLTADAAKIILLEPVTADILDVISTTAVPPFEAPVTIPSFVSTGPPALGEPKGAPSVPRPVRATGPPSRGEPAASPVARAVASLQPGVPAPLRAPAAVEEALVRTVVGAQPNRRADLSAVSPNVRSVIAAPGIPVGTQVAAYYIEAALVAAMVYGTVKSIQAIRTPKAKFPSGAGSRDALRSPTAGTGVRPGGGRGGGGGFFYEFDRVLSGERAP